MQQVPGLFIAPSEGKGRGVFTSVPLSDGDFIEVAPYVLISSKEIVKLHQTILHDYYFLLPDEKGSGCLGLGFTSIYNHSFSPNCEVVFDLESCDIEIRAIAEIQSGDELLIDYQGGLKENELWFEPL